jgi:threonine synthase
MDHMKSNPSDRGIFLETAHPAKFHETVEAITGDQLEIPERLKKFLSMEKKVIPMSSHFNDFKEYLQGLS